MSSKKYIDEMREVVERLDKASGAYYNGEEVMSNYVYDSLYDRLVLLENETGIRLPNTPTNTVGFEVVDKLEKQQHEYPALSLDKTKDLDKFVSFFQDMEKLSSSSDSPIEERGETIMWKCDGSTLQLTYNNGKLLSAVTRGNGEVGSVINHNAPYVHGIPQTIPYAGKLVVRGEAVMSYDEFNRINDQLPIGEQYKNARNLANATITLLDSSVMKQRRIDFFLFRVVSCQADDSVEVNINSFTDTLDWMDTLGFQTVPRQSVTCDTLAESMKQWEKNTGNFEYPVDGLVVALNNMSWSESQPGTGHNPHRSVGYAFKWADETEETILREIEWSASRTGLLNPVAIFDPVELEGTTVSRASIHNVSILMDLDLKVGDRISVYKANKIIPNIADNIDRDPNMHGYEIDDERMIRHSIPTHCPVCGSLIDVRQKNLKSNTIIAVCTGLNCPAKMVGSFVNFCSRDSMNIIGTSEKTVERFINAGFLKEYSDFWKLKEHHDEIVCMEGFGEKAFDNLIQSIEDSSSTDFVRFINSLGIPGIGRGQARMIKKYIQSTFGSISEDGNHVSLFMVLMNMMHKNNDLTVIDGIGDVLASNMYSFFTDDIILDAITGEDNAWLGRLLSHIKFNDEWDIDDSSTSSVSGKTFVITGSLNHFDNRKQLQELLESNGAKVSSSVTKKTSYLINNDTLSTTGKNKKAAELGIPILSEEDIIKMLNI